MKTTKKTNYYVEPRSLRDVWAWKDAVYRDTKNMTFEEQKKYFAQGVEEAARRIGAKIVTRPDGSKLLV